MFVHQSKICESENYYYMKYNKISKKNELSFKHAVAYRKKCAVF